MATTSDDERFLPTNVKPLHYVLTIDPNLETRVFKGSVSIDIDVLEATSFVTSNVHSEIKFKSTHLIHHDQSIDDIKVTFGPGLEQYTVSSEQVFSPGSKLQLQHTFEGYLNDEMSGFYRTTYKDEDGNTKQLASTQGQPSFMRRAFPCFDSPGIKATFDLTLVVEEHEDALANMPLASKEKKDGKVHHHFQTTPLMSAYLICFIVGENFHHVTTNDFHVPITIYTEGPKAAKKAQYGLDIGVRTMNFFEKAFEHKYPLPKLDMATFPNFFIGAMENWGLITYHPQCLLYDPDRDGLAYKQALTDTAVHEMAHQWFGDLVTTKTWDATWLNEGFATWAALYAINEFHPEWRVWDQFAVAEQQRAFGLDSLRHSHSIEVIARPGLEDEVLDAVSYEKGCSVLHMITSVLTTEKFVGGVAKYINKFAYGSTLTTDLWHSLASHTGVDVDAIMTPWVWQTGYPVLLIEEDTSAGTITVTQHRFFNTGDVKPEEDLLWPVPLGLRTKDGLQKTELLKERSATYKVPLDFYKINADYNAFYRTCYTPERYGKLKVSAVDGELSPRDRVGIVNDLGALAAAGYVPTTTLLDWLDSLRHERDAFVWQIMIEQLNKIRTPWMYEDSEAVQALNDFAQHLIVDALNEKGWQFSKNEDPIELKLKVTLFTAACDAQHPSTVRLALDMFKAYRTAIEAKNEVDAEKAIDPNIRAAVFATALEHDTGPSTPKHSNNFDFILELYLDSSRSGIHADIQSVLGRTSVTASRKILLKLLLDPGKVPAADLVRMITSFTHSPDTASDLWSFVCDNWSALMQRMEYGIVMRANVITDCAKGLATRKQFDNVVAFFDRIGTTEVGIAAGQAKEMVLGLAQWVERDRQSIKEWLAARKQSSN